MEPTINGLKKSKNRLLMIFILVIILILCGSLYYEIGVIAKRRRLEHKHVFYQYVVTHHVGQLTEIDGGTGLDPLSYLLTIDYRVPDKQLPTFTTDLMKKYVTEDSGETLSIIYKDPQTGARTPIADVHFDDSSGTVSETFHYQTGQTKQITEKVGW